MLHFRSRLLASTLFVGAGLISSPTLAQDMGSQPAAPADTAADAQPGAAAPADAQVPAAAAAPARGSGDIVITGSRIPQPNLTSASPVTVLSSQDIK
jgi:hypothetical protein